MPRPSAGCPAQRGLSRLPTVPWAQRALDFASVWSLSRGQGVTVAVVDSGVDYSPQLARRVRFIDLTGTGPQDCVGHGTAVASIIAASDARSRGIPFYGVAPAARILSVKVNSKLGGRVPKLARGIRAAAAAGAGVINVSITTPHNAPALRSAVSYALRRGSVIVAAAGNVSPGQQHGPFYPASYPGVLSVGAVGADGALAGFDDRRTPVSVTAPGVNVASGFPGGFSAADNGTSFAAPFVSGVAALVRALYPQLSGPQVVRRIEATADGATAAHAGAGMVNPVQALTAVLPRQPLPPQVPRPVRLPHPPVSGPATRRIGLTITGAALAGAALVVIAAAVIAPGRRRRWRPGGRAPGDL
jgi:type VII secretion-associated serine protease mycosin